MSKKSIACLFSAVVVASCGGAQDSAQTQAADSAAPTKARSTDARFTRGIVQTAVQPTRFTRCGGTDTLTLNDPSGQLARARKGLGAPALEAHELFIIGQTESEGSGALRLSEVLYASPEKFDCFADWLSFDYRATGNAPGWVAEVLGSHVKLERQGAAPAEWNDARRDSSATGLRINAGSAGNTFELELERKSCVNSVSGAWSAWTAQVKVGGVALKGCSVNGG